MYVFFWGLYKDIDKLTKSKVDMVLKTKYLCIDQPISKGITVKSFLISTQKGIR